MPVVVSREMFSCPLRQFIPTPRLPEFVAILTVSALSQCSPWWDITVDIPFVKGGFVGVDIFFGSFPVISSVPSYYREVKQGTFSIARFYERRFKRILPALFAVLLFCLALAVLVLSPWEARRIRHTMSVVATSLSLSNFYFILSGGYFTQSGTQSTADDLVVGG